jgi:phage shock protein A
MRTIVIALVAAGIFMIPQLPAVANPAVGEVAALDGVASVRYLQTVNDLQAALKSGARLYVLGSPAGMPEYRALIARTPSLVLVVVEKSVDHAADAEILVKALQNSDLIRRGIVDSFTGIPSGFAAVRYDSIENGKGRMDFHTAPRLRKVGYSNQEAFSQYSEIRQKGTSVPNALGEIADRMQQAVDADNKATIKAAGDTVSQAQRAVQELQDRIKREDFVPPGYSDSVVSAWASRLNDAQRLVDGATSISATTEAATAAEAVAKEVAIYRAPLDREIAARVFWLFVSRALLASIAGGILFSAALTRQLRLKASAEVAAKREDIDSAIRGVMELLEQATFVALNATGKQKTEADNLHGLTDQLLEQTVALQKYLQAATAVLDARGLGWVQHHLLPFGPRYVARLTTGEEVLTVSREEIQRLLMTSARLNSGYELSIGSAEDRQLSITQLIEAVEGSFREAVALMKRLAQAERELESGIHACEGRARELEAAVNGQAGSIEGLFSGKPVAESILPAVLHPESGHLAAASRARAANDALGALEEHLEPAERMIGDGSEAIAVAQFGSDSLVPAMGQTIDELASSSISADWVSKAVRAQSEQLASIVRRAPHESIEDSLGHLREDMERLIDSLATARRINGLRLEAWPTTLEDKRTRVVDAAEGIFAWLNTRGLFGSGSPELVLQEPEIGPRLLLDEIARLISEVIQPLGLGDVDSIVSIEAQVGELFAQTDALVAEAERVLSTYDGAATRLRTSIADANHIAQSLQHPVSEADDVFSGVSQKRACHTVINSDVCIDQLLLKELVQISASGKSAERVRSDMSRGHLITAGRLLVRAQQQIDTALSNLSAVPEIIALLGSKVAEGKSVLQELTELSRELDGRAKRTVGVRSITKNEVKRLLDCLDPLGKRVSNYPYESLDSLGELRAKLEAVGDAIEHDRQQYQNISEMLREALELEETANQAIERAKRQHFAHASVDISDATSSLAGYQTAYSQAQKALESGNYDSARSLVTDAHRKVASVPDLASDAIRNAERASEAYTSSYSSYSWSNSDSSSGSSFSGGYDSGGFSSYSGGSDSGGSADFSGGGD